MPWTDDQDQRLASLVEKHGMHDWNAIHHDFNALQDPDKHRTKGSVREHWRMRGKQATKLTMSKAESLFSAVASSVSIPAAADWTAADDANAVQLVKRRASELTANYAIPRGSVADDFADDFNKSEVEGSSRIRTGADLADRWRSVLREKHATSLNPFNTQQSAAL